MDDFSGSWLSDVAAEAEAAIRRRGPLTWGPAAKLLMKTREKTAELGQPPDLTLFTNLDWSGPVLGWPKPDLRLLTPLS